MIAKRFKEVIKINGCTTLKTVAVFIKSMRLPVFRVNAMPAMLEENEKNVHAMLKLEEPKTDNVKSRQEKIAIFFDCKT